MHLKEEQKLRGAVGRKFIFRLGFTLTSLWQPLCSTSQQDKTARRCSTFMTPVNQTEKLQLLLLHFFFQFVISSDSNARSTVKRKERQKKTKKRPVQAVT